MSYTRELDGNRSLYQYSTILSLAHVLVYVINNHVTIEIALGLAVWFGGRVPYQMTTSA
jgi:hypothetical protein